MSFTYFTSTNKKSRTMAIMYRQSSRHIFNRLAIIYYKKLTNYSELAIVRQILTIKHFEDKSFKAGNYDSYSIQWVYENITSNKSHIMYSIEKHLVVKVDNGDYNVKPSFNLGGMVIMTNNGSAHNTFGQPLENIMDLSINHKVHK